MKKIILIWIIGLLSLILLVNYVSARPLCECVEGEPSYPSNCQLQNGGDHCVDTPPTCVVTCNGCGNGVINSNEECDFDLESGDPLLNNHDCESEGFATGILDCNWVNSENGCTFDMSDCTMCGNGDIDPDEDCDGLVLSNDQCSALGLGYASGTLTCKDDCTFDMSDCVGQYTCGSFGCEDTIRESSQNCLADCALEGWNTDNTAWHLNDENRLVAEAGTDNSEKIIYSDFMDLRLGGTYELSAEIINPNICDVEINLDNGFCLRGDDWTREDCFNDNDILLTGTGITTIAPPTSPSEIIHNSSGFFKDVRLKITVAANCGPVKFDNIVFKELPAVEVYNDVPAEISSVTACCPIDRCWNGEECVQAYSDSQIAPIWNSLNIGAWFDEHINITNYYMTKGYRCILDENNTAIWQPAQLKYDWDFKNSGYCNSDTDCFVNDSFEYSDSVNGILRADCIRTGEFVKKNEDESFEFDKGNHYCDNGVWTTKEYLIANLLQNISDGKPYIIFCGDSTEIFNSEMFDAKGGCVAIIKEGAEEKIITGFYLDGPIYTQELDHGYSKDFMCNIVKRYEFLKNNVNPENYDCDLDNDIPNSYGECNDYPSANNLLFEKCLGDGTDKPHVYISTKGQYYLLSNEPISKIENTGFIYVMWGYITEFFQNLFGYTPQEPLGLSNQTTNYEKVYLLNSETKDVFAVQEQKYDEQLATIMTYMYINMTGAEIPANNKFNIEYINSTLDGKYYEYSITENSQSLVIKYNNPSELWPYLTAMLRDR